MELNRDASGTFFVGIGAPKAATTWLFRCLAQHPEVFKALGGAALAIALGQMANRMKH